MIGPDPGPFPDLSPVILSTSHVFQPRRTICGALSLLCDFAWSRWNATLSFQIQEKWHYFHETFWILPEELIALLTVLVTLLHLYYSIYCISQFKFYTFASRARLQVPSKQGLLFSDYLLAPCTETLSEQVLNKCEGIHMIPLGTENLLG